MFCTAGAPALALRRTRMRERCGGTRFTLGRRSGFANGERLVLKGRGIVGGRSGEGEGGVEESVGARKRRGLEGVVAGEKGEEFVGGVDVVAVAAIVKLAIDDVEGAEEHAAKAGVGGVPDFGVAAVKFGDEEGVVVFPAGDGVAFEAEGVGDGGDGPAGDEEGEGGELAGGEGIFEF